MRSIGFVGLGAMGMPMAENLLKKQFAVCGFDVRASAMQALEALGGTSAPDAAGAARNADALSDGMGHNDSTVGVRRAPMAAERPIMTTIQVTVRAAMGPARAASALLTIPVINSATTSGTTVILRPFNHKEPTISSQ